MALSELHRKYLGSLKAERDVSDHTLIAYRSDFAQYLGYLHTIGKRDELRYFTPEMVRDYQIHSAERHASKTIQRHLASLASFGEWLVRWDYLPRNPLDRITRGRVLRNPPDPLTRPELDRLLSLDLPRREVVLRALFLYAGLRREEVLNLDWNHLDFQENTIRIHGKGRKERVIGMPPPLKQVLQDYALAVGPQQRTDPLLVGVQGRRIRRHVVYERVVRWGKLIGRPLHPHLLRHTFATYFLDQFPDLALLQDIMGHADPATTRIYAKVRPHRIQDAMAQFGLGTDKLQS